LIEELCVAELLFLTCPNCGSQLEVVKEQLRFACKYCQAEHVIKKSGKVVYLCTHEQELETLKVKANRVNAERRIRQLNLEVKSLEEELQELRSEGAPLDNVRMIGLAAVTLGLFFALIYGISNSFMMGYLAAGIVLGIALHGSTSFIGKDYYIKKTYLKQLIDDKRDEIIQTEKSLGIFEKETVEI
jgi:DNA-directed RNA polymerase subunit RPC12/RpoP